MTFAFALLGCSALFLWFYFLWNRRHFYKVAWQLPGPMGLPFIGQGLNMMKTDRYLQFMDEMSRKYKSPFISWMGTKCFLYVNDPETMQTVFNSSHCTNKGEFYRFMATAIGDGLFTSSKPRWNKHRRLLNPAFNRQIINDFLPIFNAEANILIQKFANESYKTVELYDMLKKTVLEVACQTTMGKKMDFHNDGSMAIFEAYNNLTEVFAKRMLSPWLYPDGIYQRSKLYQCQQKVVNVLYAFVADLLQQNNNKLVIQHSKDDDDNDDSIKMGKSRGIFVEQLRNYVDQGLFTWDDVRDEANVMIAATFETTSTALYIVCLCLAIHPEYQDKLYNELIELFPASKNDSNGNNDNENDNGIRCRCNQVTNEQLERMPFTEMVINEALRLFAPVPIVLRTASDDFPLRNGVKIPRGTQIGLDIYNMQRSEHVWGVNAKRFRPEMHFNANNIDGSERHPFAFVPFTKGLRMCIGYRYALMLMKVLIAKIFLNYRLRTTATLDDLKIKGTISLKLCDYPLCEIIPR